ncbi:MAG: hypothetical protein UR89_C0045G0003 [Candidatus Roizmanbacteria bacterium GW2011_GWA2_35_8]|uniref:Uncharacterized protein n=1 Tax=Candidatus Roizmanbacteria bacterium GW2011_GWA2_35_8 TaxID=1618479 RepID=A0A0G0DAU8_9BACT|nr:MAG: hypothetical protein UR89_C0045G0003 [Candidatus Roizmanbacteria bacterium GW2011_GWA2_35_8]
MEGLNKIISFVLGLVVVIVFFAVVTGKLDLKSKLSKTTKSQTPSGISGDQITPTPTKTTTSSATSNVKTVTNSYGSYKTNGKTTTIPSTGLPTLFIPSLLGAMIGGSFLKKAGKRS